MFHWVLSEQLISFSWIYRNMQMRGSCYRLCWLWAFIFVSFSVEGNSVAWVVHEDVGDESRLCSFLVYHSPADFLSIHEPFNYLLVHIHHYPYLHSIRYLLALPDLIPIIPNGPLQREVSNTASSLNLMRFFEIPSVLVDNP